MIKLGAQHLEQIRRQAEQEYPHECCGLLIGRIEADGRRRVVEEISPVSNAWETTAKHHRMLIKPEDYLRAERSFRERRLGVIGNYHSHPDHPAVPSQFDLEHLAPWATMSYLVISVCAGTAVEVRSWELEEGRARFNEEEILKGD